MSSIKFGSSRKIDSFLKGKYSQYPDVRDKNVDELLQDFADDGRRTSTF